MRVSEPREALICLNRARRDPQWGVRARYLMIEVALNPENATIGGIAMDGGKENAQGASEDALNTAENLLNELADAGEAGSLRFEATRNYTVLMHPGKKNAEAAMEGFAELMK